MNFVTSKLYTCVKISRCIYVSRQMREWYESFPEEFRFAKTKLVQACELSETTREQSTLFYSLSNRGEKNVIRRGLRETFVHS